ncbi:unnamed protein product [Porites lobata]|uniref:P2X purinoreceptor 7 intracellular domain-containing protein n=1 Tax=Porites lobata TaxID=104759 RepID=A0ABN8NG60_9CNID|nr:unnamed protein product [Porites lobata]
MISDEATESVAENRISCKCKSTCSTKRTANTNRGCPCKGAGRTCGSECSCGSTAKPCRNKVNTGRHPVSSNRRPQPYQIESRPSEEEERVRENNDIKEFIQTLDEPMVRKLCIRSLRRGVGSMDFIQGLLIMEDDLDEGHEEDESDVTPTPTTSTDLACSSTAGTPDPVPSPSNNAIPWCKCKCGVCQIVPQEVEKKCCGLQRCVTTHTRFSKLCLDPDVIQLAIRNRGDIRNDRDDNSTRAFRKTGYRQYILDRYGYLGKGNRKVCSSCVVTVIRRHYPSQTGVYMRYRAE